MIAPSSTFSCNGRITSVTVSLLAVEAFPGIMTTGINLPVFQVWHPLLPASSIYSMIGQVQFQSGVHIVRYFYTSTVLLIGDERIEFQSGDVIGCYQPPYPLRLVQIINASTDDANYTSYFSHVSNLTTATINISGVDYDEKVWQPLINITIGKYNTIAKYTYCTVNLIL